MEIQTFLDQVRSLIAKDDLPAALHQLRSLLENSPNLDEVILQSARFHDIRKQIRKGIIVQEDANLTKNQIRAGLLDLLREIEEEGKGESIQKELEHAIAVTQSKNVVAGSTISAGGNVHIGDATTLTESKTSQRLKVFLYVFVPILAIFSAYMWYQYQEMKKPLSLKVQLRNLSPSSELPDPTGKLSLIYGQKTESREDVSSSVLFEAIPANFREDELRLQFEAKGFIPVDTVFVFEPEETFVLPVYRNNDLAILKGSITDESGVPLENVKVSIDCCSVFTDASGVFEMKIPFEYQRKKQRIDLYKKGYELKSSTTPVFPGEIIREYLSK